MSRYWNIRSRCRVLMDFLVGSVLRSHAPTESMIPVPSLFFIMSIFINSFDRKYMNLTLPGPPSRFAHFLGQGIRDNMHLLCFLVWLAVLSEYIRLRLAELHFSCTCEQRQKLSSGEWNFGVSDFEIQSRCSVHFSINTQEKGINSFISPIIG